MEEMPRQRVATTGNSKFIASKITRDIPSFLRNEGKPKTNRYSVAQVKSKKLGTIIFCSYLGKYPCATTCVKNNLTS